MNRFRFQTFIPLFVFVFIAACGGDTAGPPASAPPTPALASLTVSVSPSTIVMGQTATIATSGKDQFGAAIATGPVTYASATPSVATVNGSTITAVSVGQATITAIAGAVTASAVLTVQKAPTSATACKLPAQSSTYVALGFPRVPVRLKTTGDVHVSMVFVDFPDAASTRTPQSVFAIVSPVAHDYFKTVSYGRMNLVLDPTFTWRRMSKASTQYGWSSLTFELHRAYIQEALNLAATSEFTQADAIAIVANPDAPALTNGPTFVAPSSDFGVTAGSKTFLNAVTSGHDLLLWGGYWLNHEMGHAMSLTDLYAYEGATHRFVGNFSIMGNIAGFAREYFGWERWQLGWLDDDQVWCDTQSSTTEVTLSPIERAGGMKIVVIPTGATTAVIVESRRAEGYDANGSWTPGVVVYTIDTAISTGSGVLKVQPVNDTDTSKGAVALQPGASVTIGGVTVTSVSKDADGDKVRIVR